MTLFAKWNTFTPAEKRAALIWGTRTPSAKHKRTTLAVLAIFTLLYAPIIASVLLG